MTDEDHVRSYLDWVTGKKLKVLRAMAVTGKIANAQFGAPAAAAQAPPQAWASEATIAGYGLGEKITDGQQTDEISLKLYVEKKLPKDRLDNPIPKRIENPGMPAISTDVIEIGKIELQSNTQRVRPAIPGFSVGRAVEAAEAGTFGLLVQKNGQPTPTYLLSNSHAIAASGYASKGDAIIQPGGADGGKAATDTIGTLTEWIPFDYSLTAFNNLVDAAIAELNPQAASAAINQLGVPTGVNTALKRGDYVQKMGRTTNLSVARVIDVDLRIPSTYPDANGQMVRVGFSDLVLVTFYSAPGDSGSPVLDMDGKAVGLHMCGSPIIGVFCKIGNVQTALGVTVVTQ
jgi:hypothetical protein